MPDHRTSVLELVNNPNYQPLKPAVIAKKLGLATEAAAELKKTIKRMVKAGELAWGPSHLVISTQRKAARKHSGESDDGRAASSGDARDSSASDLYVDVLVDQKQDRRKSKKHSRPSGDTIHRANHRHLERRKTLDEWPIIFFDRVPEIHGRGARRNSAIIEVLARAESAARAGEDQYARSLIGIDFRQRRRDFLVHLHGEAVEPVGPVEREARNTILDLEYDGLELHDAASVKFAE